MGYYDSTNVKPFDNEIIEVRFENQLETRLNLQQFATVDYSLAEQPGMVKKIRTYHGTGILEELAMGEGNTEDFGAYWDEVEYRVGTTQGRAPYYDEQAMSDPDVIDKMINHMSEEMTNDLTDKIVAEMVKTDNKIYGADFDFDVISDAIASFPDEETEDETLFMLVNRKDMTTFRKNLKDQLKYVEDFVRKGYVGTVCGVPIYTSDAVPQGKIFLGTSKAVTIFVKKGVETERERDANTRKWIQYIRKVMLVALTNYKKMIEITSAADPRTGYTVLTEQPEDWATDYDEYYTYNAAKEKMEAVTGDAAPEFVAGKYWEKDA